MQIHCSHTEMAVLETLVENPRNPNKHPEKQIELLAKIMKHQGWRNPIVVSKRSGFIVKGHGRLAAAKLNGWIEAPIDKQDYANEADEWADMIADNKIAELAETDISILEGIKLELPENFDLDLLGVIDLDLSAILPNNTDKELDENLETNNECPSCNYRW